MQKMEEAGMSSSEGGVNVQQASAWDGPEGENWTENEDLYVAAARFVTPPLFAAAAIQPSEDVVDIGCGTGDTTRRAALEATAGSAFGIDLSSRMIERARQRAAEAGLANIRFERGDAQVYPFRPASADIAISRNGTMFFDDPVAAFANIASALRPEGRLVILCWRELARNEWQLALRAALSAGRDLPEPPAEGPSPFSLADPTRTGSILAAAGFTDTTFEPVDEPVYFGPDAATAIDNLYRLGAVKGLLQDLDAATHSEALDRLRAAVVEHETDDGVLFGTSAWIVRAMKAREREGS